MFEQHIHNWIQDFLSVPNNIFNNLPPCPFAKQALIDNKIECIEIFPDEDNISMHDNFISMCEKITYTWPNEKEVVIVGCHPKYISAEELSLATDTANTKFLNSRGYIALEDHPDELETVKDVVLNNGKYAVMFLQSKSKLSAARHALKKQDYYINWNEQYYKEVTDT